MKFIQNVKGENIKEAHLRKLGLNSTEEINDWFRKSNNNDYWIKPMNDIIDLLNKFKDKTIYVLGDYDVDGITATSIMFLALRWAGFKNINFRIPTRGEGFGVSTNIIEEIYENISNKGIKTNDVLLFTVDNGIAAIEAISKAKEYGFTVIVTDHHEPCIVKDKVVLPNADIIFDAVAIEKTADFSGYCGAANAYKVAKALLNKDQRINYLTPLAMIATFADVMTLREENYVIAYKGLKMLNEQIQNNLPSLQAMAKIFGITHWTASTIGFAIAPAINALERVEDGAAKFGVHLLTCEDKERCLDLALKLKDYNEIRKELTIKATAKAETIIASEHSNENNIAYPIIINIPDTKLGIVGIIAGKLQEKYGLPVGVFTETENGELKGSFRSPEGYNIKDHLDLCAEYFLVCGGHSQAAGASLLKENFDTMKNEMQKTAFKTIKPLDQDIFYYDVEIKNEDLISAIKENERFQPLGNGNEDLIFKITDFDVIPDYGGYKKAMRNNGVKLKSLTSTAVGFGLWDKVNDVNGPCKLTLYGYIANNYWQKQNGDITITPQIQFLELEFQEDDKLSPFAKALKEKAMNR